MNNATIEFRTRRACSTRIAWSIAVILVAAAAVAVVPFCGTIFAAPPANAQTQASKHAVTVDDLLAMFGGLSLPLMAHLIESGKLSRQDVSEAEKLLRDLSEKEVQS